jgi:hypothetical protein
MLKVLILGLLLLFNAHSLANAQTCHLTVPTGTNTIDGAALQAGHVVCLSPGNRSALTIRNVRGQLGNPVIIKNSGGTVNINNSGYAGILIENSQHLRITGSGTSSNCGVQFAEGAQECGIKIDSSSAGTGGRGISGGSRTEYVEVDHIEIGNTGETGIGIKTDAARSEFTQHNTYIHHNYIHDTTIDEGSEGMYIGATEWEQGQLPELMGVDISYNLVSRTGWDGIQVGSAVQNCKIHHNKILQDSQNNVASQKSGIMNNRGSACDIYNNYLSGGLADYGIYVQGIGGNKIYNNVIANRPTNGGSGMKISTGQNTSNSIYVWNNTIYNMAGIGIDFSNTRGSDNQIINNLVIKTGTAIAAGIARTSNNINTNNEDEAAFVNAGAGNFALGNISNAINVGAVVPINFDFLDNGRPAGAAYDVGAYEYGGTTGPTPAPTATPQPGTLTGDVNEDNRVDIVDIGLLIDVYGILPVANSKADLNNDNVINIVDVGIIIDNYGRTL